MQEQRQPEHRNGNPGEGEERQTLVEEAVLPSGAGDPQRQRDQQRDREREAAELQRWREAPSDIAPHRPPRAEREAPITGQHGFQPQEKLQRQRLIESVCLSDLFERLGADGGIVAVDIERSTRREMLRERRARRSPVQPAPRLQS